MCQICSLPQRRARAIGRGRRGAVRYPALGAGGCTRVGNLVLCSSGQSRSLPPLTHCIAYCRAARPRTRRGLSQALTSQRRHPTATRSDHGSGAGLSKAGSRAAQPSAAAHVPRPARRLTGGHLEAAAAAPEASGDLFGREGPLRAVCCRRCHRLRASRCTLCSRQLPNYPCTLATSCQAPSI